uniref:Uncharacterized protein n=1 Tax=Rhizophora mucronata TaxID=61149 RepID=A0A2P2PFL4_RHIMU
MTGAERDKPKCTRIIVTDCSCSVQRGL